jgi:hypothetical protein
MTRTANTLTVSPALRQLLIHCHTFCNVDCCRADAFDISEGIIARWLEFERVDRTSDLAADIQRIKMLIDQSEREVILAARDLESAWPADDFKAFWHRLQASFTSALNTAGR